MITTYIKEPHLKIRKTHFFMNNPYMTNTDGQRFENIFQNLRKLLYEHPVVSLNFYQLLA